MNSPISWTPNLYGTSAFGALSTQSADPNAIINSLNVGGLTGGTGTNPLAALTGITSLGVQQPTAQNQSLTDLFAGQSTSNNPADAMTQMLGQIMMMLLQALGTQQQAMDQGPKTSLLDDQLAQIALAAFEKAQQAQTQSAAQPTIKTSCHPRHLKWR